MSDFLIVGKVEGLWIDTHGQKFNLGNLIPPKIPFTISFANSASKQETEGIRYTMSGFNKEMSGFNKDEFSDSYSWKKIKMRRVKV